MYLQRISESSLARGKTVDMGLLKTSSTGDRKIMRPIGITAIIITRSGTS